MSLSQPEVNARGLVPPIVPWSVWYPETAGELWVNMHPDSPDEQHGFHILFVGPSQSGKTTLCMYIALLRDYVVVLGTKPKDSSLDRYIANGFLRIDHWPPTKADIRKGEEYWPEGKRWYIVWPKIERYEDLWAHRPLFSRLLGTLFSEGNWTFVADEGLWLGGKEGLRLGPELSAHAYGSASNGVSMYLLMQRPAGLPRIIWANVMQAEIFHAGVTADIRELASLGTYEAKDVQLAIRRLRGHQFLDLPIRGGAEWAISEVEM
jgi:hypothetical protein